MLADALVPLVAVGLAELGDKTQLSILLLSSKTRKHAQLLLGVMLAFLIVDGVAVLAGAWVIGVVPAGFLKTISGIVFIVFGALMLRGDGGATEAKSYSQNPFSSGFLLVFMTEWGDKTQIASGVLATEYNALMVLIGTMTALAVLSATAIYLGKTVLNKIDKKVMAKAAGIAFTLMGASMILL